MSADNMNFADNASWTRFSEVMMSTTKVSELATFLSDNGFTDVQVSDVASILGNPTMETSLIAAMGQLRTAMSSLRIGAIVDATDSTAWNALVAFQNGTSGASRFDGFVARTDLMLDGGSNVNTALSGVRTRNPARRLANTPLEISLRVRGTVMSFSLVDVLPAIDELVFELSCQGISDCEGMIADPIIQTDQAAMQLASAGVRLRFSLLAASTAYSSRPGDTLSLIHI
eukprot:TRINITY_DN6127_c0_g1_i10.p1 TRINITY_DN6127_c0_g1~~TRINITY_DN6127_c0_g1_i10.p1  ORF type:complete len:229 (-),score=60.90 TRINITY_DN6127_c0_g1_i10:73-759(-)